jgi:hypothetical protein
MLYDIECDNSFEQSIKKQDERVTIHFMVLHQHLCGRDEENVKRAAMWAGIRFRAFNVRRSNSDQSTVMYSKMVINYVYIHLVGLRTNKL